MSLRMSLIVICDRISFFFKVAWCSIVWIYHIFFIHSSVNGYLSCFYTLDIVNNAAIKMGVRISLWDSDFVSIGYTPRSGIDAGLYGSSIFNFLSNLHTVFHNGCSSLQSHQQCIRILFPPHPHQHLSLVFLIIDILTGVRWNLTYGFDLHFPDD